MSRKLPNYLRTFRRRAGLTQKELAFLLGCNTAAKVSRYEHFHREPSLCVILACQAIFDAPINDLFDGIYFGVRKEVAHRARALLEKFQKSIPTKKLALKTKLLSRLSNVEQNTNPVQ
jgi:transcriptional regulator with XRE-family HTH domain